MTGRIVRACALLASFVSIAHARAHAQVPPAPPRAAVPTFRFPRVETAALPNGVRVQIVEDHALAVVAVRAVLGVDETFDPPGKEGLYQVMLGALREGTTSRSAAQIADEAARTGTAVAPASFTTTPAHFPSSLELMGDMLMHPLLDESAIARRRSAFAATVRLRAASASVPARNVFYSIVQGRDDPVTRAYYATDSTVNAITRDDVRRFYAAHVGPAVLTIIIAGDVTKAQAIAAVTRVFGGWTNAVAPAAHVPATPPVRPTTIYLLDTPGTATYLYVGNSGPVRDAPDAFAADVMGTVLRDRFVLRLREKRGFMYSGATGIVWHPKPHAAEFVGSTNVAAAKADSALGEWLDILRGVRTTNPVTAAELENARLARTGYLWTGSDGADSVATRLAELARDGLPPSFLNAFASGIGAITPADVSAAAARYIDTDHLAIVVSGDRKVLEPALRSANIAPIVIVDRDGRPIS